MDDFGIVVFSCDKNEEVWPVFKHCIDKYWKNHPKIYLLTETKKCKDIKTICKDYELNKWTRRIRESLAEIPKKNVLFICDDCFLNQEVNIIKLNQSINLLNHDNVACVQYEVSGDPNDIDCEYLGFKKKTPESTYVVSFLCGIWEKEKLIDILEGDYNPWDLECKQISKGYDYYQVTNKKILSWYRDGLGDNAALRQGKWMPGIKEFLSQENIDTDLTKKGIWPDNYWPRVFGLYDLIDEKKELIEREKIELDKLQNELYELRTNVENFE
ncbi:MAG: hypothetical protein IJG68_03295 [Bacilli bacterium]|nr:hypothetical protein [Bacilli bacterium]